MEKFRNPLVAEGELVYPMTRTLNIFFRLLMTVERKLVGIRGGDKTYCENLTNLLSTLGILILSRKIRKPNNLYKHEPFSL